MTPPQLSLPPRARRTDRVTRWVSTGCLLTLLTACGGGEPVPLDRATASARSDALIVDPPAAGPASTLPAASPTAGASAGRDAAAVAKNTPAKPVPGRLLDGPPGLAAAMVFSDFSVPEPVGEPAPRPAVRFAATVTPSATVAEVNGLLQAVGGRIVEMRTGDTLFSFEVADSDKVDVRAQVMSRLENSIVLQSALPLN